MTETETMRLADIIVRCRTPEDVEAFFAPADAAMRRAGDLTDQRKCAKIGS